MSTAAVEQELERLRGPDGILRLEDVVAAAADESSPLHSHFEWDNTKAAHRYRLSQARALIRSVQIPLRISDIVFEAPAFVPASIAGGGYRRLDQVPPGSPEARSVVVDELSRVAALLGRVRKVAAVLELEDEVDTLLAAATALSIKMKAAKDEKEAAESPPT